MDENKRYIPVFNQRLAKALEAEGYVLDHTAPNRDNPYRTVFYFRNVNGIIDDLNKHSLQQVTKQKNTVPVFSKNLVIRLLEKGFILNHTQNNLNNPCLKVFFFKNSPGIDEEINKYQAEVRGNARR